MRTAKAVWVQPCRVSLLGCPEVAVCLEGRSSRHPCPPRLPRIPASQAPHRLRLPRWLDICLVLGDTVSHVVPLHLHTRARISLSCSGLPACSAPPLQPVSTDPPAQGPRPVLTSIPQSPFIKKEMFVDFSTSLHGPVCELPLAPPHREGHGEAWVHGGPGTCCPPWCRSASSIATDCHRAFVWQGPGKGEARDVCHCVHRECGDSAQGAQALPTRLCLRGAVGPGTPPLSWALALGPHSLHTKAAEGRGVCSAVWQAISSRSRRRFGPGARMHGFESQLCGLKSRHFSGPGVCL